MDVLRKLFPLSLINKPRDTNGLVRSAVWYATILVAYFLISSILGYLSGTPDGVYGADSQTAVSNFQRDHGLEVTGVADAATQQAIYGA